LGDGQRGKEKEPSFKEGKKGGRGGKAVGDINGKSLVGGRRPLSYRREKHWSSTPAKGKPHGTTVDAKQKTPGPNSEGAASKRRSSFLSGGKKTPISL